MLKALRNLDRKKRLDGEVVATAGEILVEDDEKVFERDSATDDTRVRTAIAWAGGGDVVDPAREPSAGVSFVPAGKLGRGGGAPVLERNDMTDVYRGKLLIIVETLIDADPDEGVSTDELMGGSGLSPEGVRGALYDLERLGIASNDMALTAFVHAGVERSSQKRFEEAANLGDRLD